MAQAAIIIESGMLKTSRDKLVLLTLAKFHHNGPQHGGRIFPSMEACMQFSSLTRPTFKAGLAALIDLGLVKDTGERVGRTGQIPVYLLALDKVKTTCGLKVKKSAAKGENQRSKGEKIRPERRKPLSTETEYEAGYEAGEREAERTIPANPFLTVGAV